MAYSSCVPALIIQEAGMRERERGRRGAVNKPRWLLLPSQALKPVSCLSRKMKGGRYFREWAP